MSVRRSFSEGGYAPLYHVLEKIKEAFAFFSDMCYLKVKFDRIRSGGIVIESVGFKRSLKTNLKDTFLNLLTLAAFVSVILLVFQNSMLIAGMILIVTVSFRILVILINSSNYICPSCKNIIDFRCVPAHCYWCDEKLPSKNQFPDA